MRKFLLAAAAIAALASATATAQNASPNNPTTGTAGVNDKMNASATHGGAMGANPAPRTAANAPQAVPAEGPNFVQVQNSDMLSSNVVGLDIYNGQNNKIGKIQDIAFDASKQVTGYILSIGGFLGMGTHYVAVNPSSVNVQYDAGNKTWRATMNATKDRAQGGAGVQVRRSVDGQQELSAS